MRALRLVKTFISSWIGGLITVLLFMFFIAQGFFIPSRSMVGSLYEGDVVVVSKFSYGVPIPRLPWINKPILPDFFDNGHLISGPRPKRGDIVVFIPPGQNVNFVKRLFAKGGDEVLFAREGLYLHAQEGDEVTKKLAPDSKTIYFGGKLFVLNPYSHLYPGIHYSHDNRLYYYLAQKLQYPGNYGTNAQGETIIKGTSMSPVSIRGEVGFYKKIEPNHYYMIGDNRDNSDDSRIWGSVSYSNIVGKPEWAIFSLSLLNSEEFDAKNNPKKRFIPRWNRSFVAVENLKVVSSNKDKREAYE